MPAVTCDIIDISGSYSAIWVGLEGNGQLVQIGTQSNCASSINPFKAGKPEYKAFWEDTSKQDRGQSIGKKIAPGDRMIATVTYLSSINDFWLFRTCRKNKLVIPHQEEQMSSSRSCDRSAISLL